MSVPVQKYKNVKMLKLYKSKLETMKKKIAIINFSAALIQDDYTQSKYKNKDVKNREIYYYSAQKESLVSYLASKFPEVHIELIGLNTSLPYRTRYYNKCQLIKLPNLGFKKMRIFLFDLISFLYLFSKHKPSMIYAYTDGKLYPYLGALLYAKLLKVPFFVDLRNAPHLRFDTPTLLYKKIVTRTIDNLCLRNGTRIIHISEKSKRSLKSDFQLYKKSIVVPSCARDIFMRRERENKKNKRLTFTYWGVIAKERNLDIIIRGFAKAKSLNNKCDAQFFLIGGGDDLTYLKKLVQELNASDIIFKEYMKQKDLSKFLQETSVAVVPIPPKEFYQYSSPLKLAEAIAMELPIIASDIEPNQIVKEHNLGIICNHDVGSYARAFLEFCSSSNLDRFQENCKKVKQLFMPETVFKNLGEEIDKIING